jgi:hypothetical protein
MVIKLEWIMKTKSIIFLPLLMLMITSASGQELQEYDNLSQVRLIKINRMSEAWIGSPVELRLYDGTKRIGRFLAIENSAFKLDANDSIYSTNIFEVKDLVLKRQPEDLLLASLISIGVATLFVGGTSLGIESSTGSRADFTTLAGVAAVGATVGFTIGWKSFFQDIVIALE